MTTPGSPLLLRWILRLYPAAFRAEYGVDLLATLAARARDLPAGRVRRGRFWLREGAALLRGALQERARWRVDGRGLPLLDQLGREFRFAVRRLLVTPVFGIAAVFTLALALGANVAVFTLVRRIILNPFPYRDAGQLVLLEHTSPEIPQSDGIGITQPIYLEYQGVSGIEDMALYQKSRGGAVRIGEVAERIVLAVATPNLAGLLGVTPQLGRWFGDGDVRLGAPPAVAVISHAFWQRALGGDPAALGRTVEVNGYPLAIIGVMPATFQFPTADTQIWTPHGILPAGRRDRGFNFEAIARLAPGTTTLALGRTLNALLPVLARSDNPELSVLERLRVSAAPVSLRERTLGSSARALWILFGAVGLVLLIACANVANLFLVRMESRQRDLVIRRALGAGRRSVLLYFLSESMVIGLLAGAMGFLLAMVGVRVLVSAGPDSLPRLDQVRIDGWVALFTAGLAVLSGLLLGAVPLLRRTPGVSAALNDTSRGNTAGRLQQRGRNLLAGTQIALALVLLVGAGLILRSFQRLQQVDPGFQTEQRLVFRLSLSEREYSTHQSAIALHQQLLTRIRQLPGVAGVSGTTCFPLGPSCWASDIVIENRQAGSTGEAPAVWYRRIAPEFFRTMGTRIVRGRDFDAADFERATGAVLVNRAFADLHLPGVDPIGQRVSPEAPQPGQPHDWLTVVGVVANTAGAALTETEPSAQVFLPLTALRRNIPDAHSLVYLVHGNGDPASLLPAIRREVASLNPNLPVANAELVAERLARTNAHMTFTMVLLLVAAGVALVLGIVGVYAVFSYSVSQRVREVGVRVALGATPARVRGMILREGFVVIASGVLLGLAAALLTSRVLATLLFGVSPADGVTYVAVAGILSACALLACYAPARRAARLDPAQAMRNG